MTTETKTLAETPITNADNRSILGFPQPNGPREEGVLVVDGVPYHVIASRSGGICKVECASIDFWARGSSIDEGTIESNRDYVRNLIRRHLGTIKD